MPRGSGVTSRASRATPASSSARCPSPRSTGSTGSAPRSRSSRRPAAATRGRPSARSPRSTTISACSSPGSARGIARNCDRPVAAQTREQIVARILEDLPAGTAFRVLAPVVRGQKGEYKDLFADLARAGYVRARVNGQVVNLSDDLSLDRQIKHHIEVVIDRLKVGPEPRPARGWPRRSSRR